MIYLDYNASAPLRPEAAEAMLAAWGNIPGNASSLHGPGRRARGLLEDAREQVAAALGGRGGRLLFGSGATEANNMALAGWMRLAEASADLVLVAPTEHPSVLAPLQHLAQQGRCSLEWLDLDDHGRLDMSKYEARLDVLPVHRIACIALMAVNNETGAPHPWREAAHLAFERGIAFHLDATQALGKTDLGLSESGVSTAAISAHKAGGPQGTGALWIAPGRRIEPLLRGGPQERGLRSGTENVAGAAGFAAALAAAEVKRAHESAVCADFRERLLGALGEAARPTLPREVSVPSTVHLRIPVPAEPLLVRLDLEGFAVSAGSACSSGAMRPSHVLLAMGWTEREARRAIRVSTGWATDPAEADRFAEALRRHVAELAAFAD